MNTEQGSRFFSSDVDLKVREREIKAGEAIKRRGMKRDRG